VRIELIFGFLGSGKTTLARRILDQWGSKAKLALIVNEFGEVGVDGQILEGNGIDVVELSSGCLCCTLKGSLLGAIEELGKRKCLDHIVIEATGVAEPDELIQTLADPSFNERFTIGPITTVVDAAKFSKIRAMLGPFYEGQIIQADLVILNKVDLADAGVLDRVADEVRELNPNAVIRFAEHCDVDLAEIMVGQKSSVMENAVMHQHEHVSTDDHDHSHAHHHGHGDGHAGRHAPVDSFVVDLSGSVPRAALDEFYATAPETLWRSKGYLLIDNQPSLVQYALSGLEITATSARERYYLVLIGKDLDRSELTGRLERLTMGADAA